MKTAIIGNGYWSKIIQPYVKEKFDIVQVCDSKTDLSLVWNDKDITSVFILTPIHTHCNLVKEALVNGKCVFVEKPLSMNTEECLEILNISKCMGCDVLVDYTYMFSDVLRNIPKPDYIFADLCRMNPYKYEDMNVHWVLTPHILSIIGLFYDLSETELHNYNLHNGTIKGPNFESTVSLNTINHTSFRFNYGSNKATYDAGKDGLRNAVDHFSKMLNGKVESNLEYATLITEVIEKCLKNI